MAENKNIFKIEGVIFAKPSRKVTSQKDGKEYEFNSIILEIKREYKGTTYIELPEFHLSRGVDDSGFDVNDYVELTFALAGKKVNDTFHKTEARLLYIRHPDIEGNNGRDVGGNVYPKKKEEVFVAPNPYEKDDDQSDLPF